MNKYKPKQFHKISWPSYREIKPAYSHYKYYGNPSISKRYFNPRGSAFQLANQYKMIADRRKYLNLQKANQRLKTRYKSRSASRSPPPHPYSPRTRRTSRSPSPKLPYNRFYNYYNIKKYRPSRRFFRTFRKYKRKKRIK